MLSVCIFAVFLPGGCAVSKRVSARIVGVCVPRRNRPNDDSRAEVRHREALQRVGSGRPSVALGGLHLG